jgi:hypothetical protein
MTISLQIYALIWVNHTSSRSYSHEVYSTASSSQLPSKFVRYRVRYSQIAMDMWCDMFARRFYLKNSALLIVT